MKLTNVGLSLLAFSFGALVVGVSLSNANQSFIEKDCESGRSKIYFGQEILPDHLLYPVLMIRDRAKLKSLGPDQSVYLQLQYAKKRLSFVEVLIERGNQELAFSTLTKSQKYLIKAAVAGLENEFSLQEKNIIVETIESQQVLVLRLLANFSESQVATIEQLLAETDILKTKLLDN
jgi:hypothetical protein